MPDSPTLGAYFIAHPHFFWLALFLLGLLVGSFLNVVILRLPVMMRREWTQDCRELLELESAQDSDEESLSLSFPGSRCPACKTVIKPWQNIPVLSFLLLRGRCAHCATTIGWRYPAIEFLTASLSVVVGLYFGWSPELPAYLFLTWTLIALSGIDIDTQFLPDDLTLPLLWAGLLFNLFLGSVSIADAVLGAAAGYLLLWSIYWAFKLVTGKEGMGYGDFKLLAALGAWMGWQSLPVIILLSSAVGAVIGLIIIVAIKQGRSVPLPFGPYLAAAGWINLIWGSAIAASFLGYSV